jgi:hypothetical protein
LTTPGSENPKRTALQKKAVLCGLVAVVLQIAYWDTVGGVGANPPPPPEFWIKAWTTGPSCWALWVLSASALAQSKGYAKSWGLVGLLTCCGIFLVALLPNRWRPEETGYEGDDYPRPKTKT